MSPEHTVSLCILAIVLFFSTRSFKLWLNYRVKNKEIEHKNKESELLSDKEKNYINLIEKMNYENNDTVKNISNIAKEMHENILKNIKSTNADIEYYKQSISAQQIKELIKIEEIS